MTPTPPLLTAACVLLWGLQTDLLALAAPLAVALEAPRWTATRLELRTALLARTFDFGLLGAMAIAGYLITTGSPTQGIALILQWLPVLLAPFVLGQTWSGQGGIDLKALWSVRQRREPRPARPYPIDFRWLYLPICLVAASAANQRTPLFFSALALLGAWALLGTRDRSRPIALWAVLVATATGLGYAGQLGLNRLQVYLFELAFTFDPDGGDATDPYRSHTALGHIGTLKLSDRIVLRLRTEPDQPPPGLLHRATYDRFSGTTWFAREAPLEPLPATASNQRWTLASPPTESGREVMLSTRFAAQRAVLALPTGAVAIDGLNASGLRRNRFGVLEVSPVEEGLASYGVTYLPGFTPPSATPTPADLEVPERMLPLLARHRDTLGLREVPPAEAVRRLSDWFDTRFAYTLYRQDDTLGRDALETFLDTTRAGHCEYFATTSVLLLRAAGIPARYVTGYAVTEWSDLEQAYLVRRRHAHAWAAAYVDGRWQTIDTTPTSWIDTERAESSVLQPLGDAWDWLVYSYQRWRRENASRSFSVSWLLGLVLLVPVLAWRLRHSVRKPERTKDDPERRAQAVRQGADSPFYRLEHVLGAHGRGRGTCEPLTQWAARLSADLPSTELTARLGHIIALHYGYRFDPAVDSSARREDLAAEVDAWLALFERSDPRTGRPGAGG